MLEFILFLIGLGAGFFIKKFHSSTTLEIVDARTEYLMSQVNNKLSLKDLDVEKVVNEAVTQMINDTVFAEISNRVKNNFKFQMRHLLANEQIKVQTFLNVDQFFDGQDFKLEVANLIREKKFDYKDVIHDYIRVRLSDHLLITKHCITKDCCDE